MRFNILLKFYYLLFSYQTKYRQYKVKVRFLYDLIISKSFKLKFENLQIWVG